MPGAFQINAEDIRLATTPGLEVASAGLQVKTADATLQRQAGGMSVKISANKGIAIDGSNGLALGPVGNGLNLDGGGALQVILDGGSLAKSGSGLRVSANGVGPTELNQGANYTFGGTVGFTGVPSAGSDPVSGNDLARKGYVDAAINVAKFNFDVKDSVRAATESALAAHTRSGNVLTASANGAIGAIDGVNVGNGDRVLVKNEGGGTHLENGLYVVTDAGSAGTPWVLTRAADADSNAEVTSGLFTSVEEGTKNASARWVLKTQGGITLNTTALSFARYDAGTIQAGAGMTRTGDTLDLVAADASLQVNNDSVGVKMSANKGLNLDGSNGIQVQLDANGGIGVSPSGIKAVADANGGVMVDNNGIGVKLDLGASGQLAKSGAGLKAVAGGAGSSVKWLTVDTQASAFTFASGISSKTGFPAPDAHANALDGQELFKGGLAVMKRVPGAPAAGGEWRFNGTTLEIFGDVTQSGDVYRAKYLQAV